MILFYSLISLQSQDGRPYKCHYKTGNQRESSSTPMHRTVTDMDILGTVWGSYEQIKMTTLLWFLS